MIFEMLWRCPSKGKSARTSFGLQSESLQYESGKSAI